MDRRFRLLAMLVLLGLWLMHGVSATTNAGCHGVPMMTMSRSMPTSATSTSMAAAAPSHVAANAVESLVAGAPAVGAQMGGETCLSGQPPSSGDFLLVLALVALALAFSGPATELPRPPSRRVRRHGPPGPVGRALLTTVCVSRT